MCDFSLRPAPGPGGDAASVQPHGVESKWQLPGFGSPADSRAPLVHPALGEPRAGPAPSQSR